MKKIIVFITLFIFANLLISPVSALNLINDAKKADIIGASSTTANLAGPNGAGYNTNLELSDIIATIIRIVLSILGTIFLILIFVAGNEWMQAGGNEEKVKKSKDTIMNLLIGLCVVLVAFALTYGMGGLLSGMLLNK